MPSTAPPGAIQKNAFTLIALVLLMGAGLFLRLHNLAEYAPNVDEVMHLRIAEGRDLGEVWRFSLLETHPPLGHFPRWFWNYLGPGGDMVYARLLSVLLGMAAIPVYFMLGREAGGRPGALLGASIAALGYLPLVQSQLVRNYALFVLFTGLLMWAFLRLRKTRSSAALAAYGVCALLAVLTHFGGVILVGGLTLVLVWEYWRESSENARWQRLLPWLALNGVIGLVICAVVLVQRPYIEPMLGSGFGGSWFSYIFSVLRFAVISALFFVPASSGGSVPLVVIIGIVSLRAVRKEQGTVFYFALVIAPIILAWLLHLAGIYPIDGYARRHIWLMAPLVALIAHVIHSQWSTPVKKSGDMGLTDAGLFLAFLIGLHIWYNLPPPRDPQEFSLKQSTLQDLRQYLDENVAEGDVIIADFHVALYFFEGEQNLYRERWESFGGEATASVPVGRGTMITQPGRRYIRSTEEFRELARAALAQAEPHREGFRVFLINWELTNPAQRSLKQKRVADELSPSRTFSREGAVVYPIDGSLFAREVLPEDGRLHALLDSQ